MRRLRILRWGQLEVTTLVVVLAVVQGSPSRLLGSETEWLSMVSSTSQGLRGVWGSGSNSVYAVGLGSTILHYSGVGTWTSMLVPPGAELNDVHGTGENDIWAVGWNGTILHRFDGGLWEKVDGIATDLHLHAVWAISSANAWAVGERADGSGGVVLHWDGASWSDPYGAVAGPAGPGPLQFDAVWAGSGSEVYAVGHDSTITGVCYRYDGATWAWQTVDVSPSAERAYYAVRGVGGDRYIAAEGVDLAGDLLRGTTSGWTAADVPGSTALFDIWPNGSDDIHACSYNGKIFHYDGTQWSTTYTGVNGALQALWGSPDGDVYAVGANGTILRLSGSAAIPAPGAFLLALLGGSLAVRVRRLM